ncbi:YolD-like family protein [Mesobacillus maritimus]|uniref:YolD-like family protein n=1 Tax=Mesobacillus maritimus TaxID=1643336 RepID=UPI0020417C71|nr:YolD-like family protein [Mesobacillus maritimus]MCM3585754.1 YolD-like family protein [Mesobacillus maritimus]
MAIRDRGKIKWAPASFLPELRSMMREAEQDELRQKKPLIDSYEIEEFDRKICYAMEFNFPVLLKRWTEGFTYEEKGRVHYVDSIRKEVRMVTEDGAAVRIPMADIIEVEVIEQSF